LMLNAECLILTGPLWPARRYHAAPTDAVSQLAASLRRRYFDSDSNVTQPLPGTHGFLRFSGNPKPPKAPDYFWVPSRHNRVPIGPICHLNLDREWLFGQGDPYGT
jgi:hypothetical protein